MCLAIFKLLFLIATSVYGAEINNSKRNSSQTQDKGSSDASSPKIHDPHFFPNRSGIVHLFEWKYEDIARECEEYLGPNGFAGVQTSPASENLILPGRPWYERYQPISYELNTRSGNAKDFFDMTQRCNKAGIRIYVDVVFNHMTTNARNARGTGTAFADPNNFYYPLVPFYKDDFHQPVCALVNFSDPFEARFCELLELHDLDQSIPRVRWSIILFLDKLTALGAAGFRVDAAKHMNPDDLRFIYDNIRDLPTELGYKPKSRPFIFQEALDGMKFDYTDFGLVTEFVHPINMAAVFKNHRNISTLKDYAGPSIGMLKSENALVFVDNHDLQRQNNYVLTYKDPKKFKAAYVFTLAHPYGVPRVMSSFNFTSEDDGPPHDPDYNILSPKFDKNGQCANGWVCEHRWNAIKNMVEFRNVVGDSPLQSWWSDGEGVASFCRGQKGFVLLNTGRRDFNGPVNTCLPKGVYCDVVSGELKHGACTGIEVSVEAGGKARVSLPKNAPEGAIALHVSARKGPK